VKIDKELFKKEFYKLPQLTRIEFRQREAIISRLNDFDVMPLFLLFSLWTILTAVFFMTAFLGAPHYGDSWFIAFYKLAILFAKATTILFVVNVALKLLFDYTHSKELKKLVLEYCPKLRSIK
jgi:hypothetical protein